MAVSAKTTAIMAASALAAGLLIGFIPTHLDNSSLTSRNQQLQSQLASTNEQLAVSDFTVRAGDVYVETAKNNFSVAFTSASAFFTDLRKSIDRSHDGELKPQLEGVMASRDEIIAGLAKADPAITSKLQEVFLTMHKIELAHAPFQP